MVQVLQARFLVCWVLNLDWVGFWQNDRVRWYGIYNGPDNECVGKVQLFLHYTMMSSENSTKV